MKIVKYSKIPKILVITKEGRGVTDEGAKDIAAFVPYMAGLVMGKPLLDKEIALAYIEQHEIALVCLLTIEDGVSVINSFPKEALEDICENLKNAGKEETTWQVLKRMLDAHRAQEK